MKVSDNQRRILDAPRDHLVHVMPRLEVCGIYNMITELTGELKNYRHTLLHETPMAEWDEMTIWQAQAAGLEVVQVDRITTETLADSDYTGAILYNVVDHPNIGESIPSLYYSYGRWDPDVKPDFTVACSEYATRYDRDGKDIKLDPEWVLPPLVQTRSLRRLVGPPHPFSVGLITSGIENKYPCRLIMQLLNQLPRDVQFYVTTLPKYRHPGMQLALDHERTVKPARALYCAVRPTGGIQYTVRFDALIYACDPNYHEPYGRLVVEAMALGKPVICERRSVFADRLEHGVNALLFDDLDEVLGHVDRLKNDTVMCAKLAANAQLWASWEDISVHIGKFKRILRMIGT